MVKEIQSIWKAIKQKSDTNLPFQGSDYYHLMFPSRKSFTYAWSTL